MSTEGSLAAFDAISNLCDKRWDRHYTRAKLRSDPVYSAVHGEVKLGTFPILDIGCGIGLLAHYLASVGHLVETVGIDYDERKIASAQHMAAKVSKSHLWSFSHADARTGLPDFQGHVVILDILQFFSPSDQEKLLHEAAKRVAPQGKLIIRSGIKDDTWRFKVTVLGDYLAKLTLWMKAAPTCYPTADFYQSVLKDCGLKVKLQPLWGGTPFNNYLIIGARDEATSL